MKATLGERSALRTHDLRKAEQAVIEAAHNAFLIFRKGEGVGEDLAMMTLAGAFRRLNHVRRKGEATRAREGSLTFVQWVAKACNMKKPVMFYMKKPVMFYLPAEEKERLCQAAREQGRTISEVMRRAIVAYLDWLYSVKASRGTLMNDERTKETNE